ncbi:MAG: transglutaminase-like cysteine peptidase [Sphingomicrobium sp.]
MVRIAWIALAGLSLGCGEMAAAQTVIGTEGAPGRYNRLRDLGSRGTTIFAPASPDVLGTAAIGAGVTFYDARFRRVSNTDLDHPLVKQLAAPLAGLSPEAQLFRAQAEVLSRVRWSHDLDNMKVADFWSNAGETLERGAGDSEDIAIATMQVLKAAGFDGRNLYISIGRDRKVGQHIVLLARTASGFMMLDDHIRHPVSARGSQNFTPIFTIGQGKSWIHGRRRESMTAHASAQ